MTDQPDNDGVARIPRSDLDVDIDGERDVVEAELDEALPSQLDAAFDAPVPDVIDQRREVLLDADDYEA